MQSYKDCSSDASPAMILIAVLFSILVVSTKLFRARDSGRVNSDVELHETKRLYILFLYGHRTFNYYPAYTNKVASGSDNFVDWVASRQFSSNL